MYWLCSDCGKDVRDHTLREVNDGYCHQPPPPILRPLEATEIGKVNPEAVEDTGEEFSLNHWNLTPRFEEP